MAEKKNLRKLALTLLTEYESLGKYVNLSLNSHKADGLDADERARLCALLYTTVEHKLTYDYYIASLSGRSIDKIDTVTKNILRLGFCQLLDMSGIPTHAAVNESVKLARSPGERAFVNGILRRADRERDHLPLPDEKKNEARYLSVKYSFPLWIVKSFISNYGRSGAEELLSRISEIAPTDLTVNTNKISTADFHKKLNDAGYAASISPLSPNSVRIYGSAVPKDIPGYSEGEFFVQDAACAAAIYAFDVKRTDAVIDVCSAPGGKSFAAAIMADKEGRVTSFDIHESKISLITDGAARLGLSNLSASVRDAREPDESLFSSLDKVICDVPCSGLGVLAKKPDLRYRSEEGLEELPELQYEILTKSARYLKPGGRLIYSTCTLRDEENANVVTRFLKENSGYHTVDFTVGEHKSDNGSFTFLPHVHNTDGFFMSIIERDTNE